MSYCENCGQQYSGSKNYCRRCGQALVAHGQLLPTATDTAQAVEIGFLRAHNQIAYKRRAASGSNDSLELYLKCIAVIAFFHGVSFIVGPSFGKLLDGDLSWMLAAFIVLATLCKTLFDLRYGDSLARSLLGTFVAGVLIYGLIVGGMWYLSTYLHSLSGKPLLVLPSLPTPTRHSLPTSIPRVR